LTQATAWLDKLSTSRRFMLLQWLLTFLAALPIVLFAYLLLDARLQDYYREHLQVRSRSLLVTYRDGGTPALSRGITERLVGGGQKEAAYLLQDAHGRTLAGNIVAWPTTASIPAVEATAEIQRKGHDRPERACVNTYRLRSGERLLIGSVRLADKKSQQALIEQILGVLLLMLPVALIVSRLREQYIARRVKDITTVANAIAAGDLSRRVDLQAAAANDDFRRIAVALNCTFSRVQTLVEDLGFVTNALAHELRSPLTRVSADLETLASAKGAQKSLLLQRISGEIEGMLRTIKATLDLSRAESEIGVSSFSEFQMKDLLFDLWEVYEASAEERGISLLLGPCGDWKCFGNRDLIAQAVSNLLDNALRHSSATRVELGCIHARPMCSIWVADNGVGIPEEERSEALRKFGRLDRARTTDGTGLGLPFVEAVAALHNGNLTLEDNKPGLRASINVPFPTERQEPRQPLA
jgi:signal transduction histidine kinase